MKILTAAAVTLALALTPMTVRAADDDILKHLINSPNSASWIAYGSQTSKQIKDAGVQGGAAFEVQVTAAGPQTYSTAAQQDITAPIKKGDKLIAVLWLKANTKDTAPVPLHLRMQVNSGSYDGVVDGDITIDNTWKRYPLQGVATADHPKGSTVLVVHLGQAKQTIDLGPAFVLDMGPDTAAQ
jgi:hypothetical protein